MLTRWIVIDTRDGTKLGDYGSQVAATERLELLAKQDGPFYVLRSVKVHDAEGR